MLAGRRIAVPETRELDLFVRMLERQGAVAIRCPLVSIHDMEDPTPVEAWLERSARGEHDDLVLYTGEGVIRLLGFARRRGIEAQVVAGFSRARKIVRGPKPARALRSIGLAPDITTDRPTTDGLAAVLSRLDLRGRCVGVQLYPGGEEALSACLDEAGARSDPVLCYRYASHEEDRRVLQLIGQLASGGVDLIAFTSSPQVRRLQQVARDAGREGELDQALQRTLVAAVGPVTAQAVQSAGWRVDVVPEESFHLKPLVAALAAAFAQA